MLRNLGIGQGSAVLEGGCGNGIAIGEVLDIVGPKGRIVGIDPTEAFIEAARTRAVQLKAGNAQYEVGDIRKLPYRTNEFDAAFCDKVLIHAGPPRAALSELVRVTRPKGRVGVVDWLPFFALSATHPDITDAFNAIFRNSTYDYYVSANLTRHLHAAGLADVEVRGFLAHTDSLDGHPFWRAFIVDQAPMFVQAGLIGEKMSQELLQDLNALNEKGEFSASFVVQCAVGSKPGT